MSKKLVVHRYTNLPPHPGIGDFLRGTLWLEHFSDKFEYRVVVDWSQHPCHFCFEPSTKEVYSHLPCHDLLNCEFDNLIHLLKTQDVVVVRSNFYQPWGLDYKKVIRPETIKAVRAQMTPSFVMRYHIQKQQIQLQLFPGQYDVVHIRMKDQDFSTLPDCSSLEEMLLRNRLLFQSPVLLLTSSAPLKNYITTLQPLWKSTSSNPIHLGMDPETLKNIQPSYVEVLETMTEFFLLSEARQIYSFSSYIWGSGFSHQCAIIYEVPLRQFQFMIPEPPSIQNKIKSESKNTKTLPFSKFLNPSIQNEIKCESKNTKTLPFSKFLNPSISRIIRKMK
jgi:hypothetical protein